MFPRLSHWLAFFSPQRGSHAARSEQPRRPNNAPPGTAALHAGRLPGAPASPAPTAPFSLLATPAGRVQVFFCQLPEDWRQPFTNELLRILRQRRRGGYLPLPPLQQPLARERFGRCGEALRSLETRALYDLLRQQVEEGLRMLELPEELLCQARRCSDLAWQAARLGQLVRELDRPRRKVDAWQALWQALWTLPGARVPPIG